jgi:uncharacterized protein (DUF2236 family)
MSIALADGGLGSLPQTWIVHREMALLLGWPRAILMQFAHPLVAQGVADHSHFSTDVCERWRRLSRTLDAMLTLTFGTEADARAVAARINGIHDRVRGHVRGGSPYSARDPELLLWVHATCVQSFMLGYETFVRRLALSERDRYCEESADGAVAFGIPASWLPRTAAALDAYVNEMLERGPIVVGDTARGLAAEVVAPRSPLVLRPAFAVLRWITAGLLPPRIRDAYGFAWSARRQQWLDATAVAARVVIPRLPETLRCWPSARVALGARRDARVNSCARPAV